MRYYDEWGNEYVEAGGGGGIIGLMIVVVILAYFSLTSLFPDYAVLLIIGAILARILTFILGIKEFGIVYWIVTIAVSIPLIKKYTDWRRTMSTRGSKTFDTFTKVTSFFGTIGFFSFFSEFITSMKIYRFRVPLIWEIVGDKIALFQISKFSIVNIIINIVLYVFVYKKIYQLRMYLDNKKS